MRKTDPVIDPTRAAFDEWLDTLVRDPVLVTPCYLAYVSYRRFCADWGFEQGSASTFMRRLAAADGLSVRAVGGEEQPHLFGAYIGVKQCTL